MNKSIKDNLNLLKQRRKTMYDGQFELKSNTYQQFTDHKQMSSHEFALFQKEQFKKRRLERKKRMQMRFLVVLITLVLVFLFLYSYETSNADFWAPHPSEWSQS